MSISTSPHTSDLSKARGLGSAKDGTGHWWLQRVTAVLIIPFMSWFVYSVCTVMLTASRSTVADWFASPINSIVMLALLTAMVLHSKLGVQVVIEDYIHATKAKYAALFLLNIIAFLLAIISAVAIIKLHIMGI